jgi:hypothetical protein
VLILEVVTGKPPLVQYGDHLGWKWNGNIPNRTASFSIFYLIEFAFYVRLYCFRFRFHISNVKVENGLDIFRLFSTFLFLIRNIPNSKFGLNRIWLPIINVQVTRQSQVWSIDAHWPHYIGSSPRRASLSRRVGLITSYGVACLHGCI